MAQFRGVLQGNRGMASRVGHKSTGLMAAVDGWNGGVCVVAQHNDAMGDYFEVYATGGSNRQHADVYIGTVGNNGEWKPKCVTGDDE